MDNRTLVDARERTAPERIYLQDGCDDPGCEDCWSNGLGGVTWCVDRIHDNDTEYVRADLLRAALERVEALEAALPMFARNAFHEGWRAGLLDGHPLAPSRTPLERWNDSDAADELRALLSTPAPAGTPGGEDGR